MAEDYVSEDDEPASKRRKTGDDSYVDVDEQPEEDEFDGFIVDEDEIEEDDRRRKRKRKKKKKRKKHRSAAPITEDTLRMLAEQQGKTYRPDIDIDQGLSDDSFSDDGQSDDSQDGTQRRVLKKTIRNFDEESVMDQNLSNDEDDFHDYGDNESVISDVHHRDVDNDDFVVNDMHTNNQYAYNYENDQIEKLVVLFGKNVYNFLGVRAGAHEIEDLDDDQKDAHLIELEEQRKLAEAKKSERELKEYKRGLQGLDPKQKQTVLAIINNDIPERLQERIAQTTEEQTSKHVFEDEAQWIQNREYFVNLRANGRPIANEHIIVFLTYFRVKHYDVPYIVTYLQDEYPLDISPADVWKIDEFDAKYQQIYLRKQNIKSYLEQIVEKLSKNIANMNASDAPNDENHRWLERVEEAKKFLFDATSHEELEAVDLFLNIVPTQSVSNMDDLNVQNGEKSKFEYPPAPNDLISAECVEYVAKFTPHNCKYDMIRNVFDEICDKLTSNPKELEMRRHELEIDEMNKLKLFYEECRDDQSTAADKEFDSGEIQGDEAYQFIGAAQTNLDDLNDTIQRITVRISQLQSEKERMEQQHQIEKYDFESIKEYYGKILQIMPKTKRTKKAASMLKSGKLNKLNAFKLSIPSILLPLCRNIGFSKIISDNIKAVGTLYGGMHNQTFSNLVLESAELSEICSAIVGNSNKKYCSKDDVVTDAIYHLARHIGHEPHLKVWICKELEENGVICTQPTLKGRDLIEWTDELAAVKRLENKPIGKFLEAKSKASLHWLLIDKGCKQNLIRNHINIPNETLNEVRSQYHASSDYVDLYYGNDSTQNTILFFLYKLAPLFIDSASSNEWKRIKLKILHDALNLYLIPCAVKWTKHKMFRHDEECVIEDACQELQILSNIAGQRDKLRGENLLSIIVGEENSPSFLVLLNHFGDVIDETMLHYMKTHVRINPHHNNNNANGQQQQQRTIISTHDRLQLEKKNGDLKLFKEFVEQHKPALIVIDAGNLLARNFKLDIEKVLASNEYSADLRVEYVDPCVSLLYRNSDDAIKEFQSWSVCQRQAVSLGRFVLDPTAEICKRWNIDSKTGKNEMLSLPLHKNLNDVDPNKLLTAFRKVLMNVVNESGVMINLCSQRDYLNGSVQFLSGFGPRKATNLIFELKQQKGGFFQQREHLLKRHILGPNVYKNAIGFIRINRMLDRPASNSYNNGNDHSDDEENDDEYDDDHDQKSKINLLDDTRIHVDDYHWAKVVVISAMDIDEENAYSNDTLLALRKPDNLNKLEILNLDIFAERIRKRRKERIVHKLYLIKQEVRCGFKESRKPFSSPGEDELYHLLCGQTRASLREGMLINVEIKSITASGIKCKLPSCGLDAWLPAENISTSVRDQFGNIKNMHNGDIQSEKCRTERKDLILSFLKQKTHLEARIISIDKSKFNVKLSCLKVDIENANGQHQQPTNADAYLNMHHPDDDSKKAVEIERRERIKNRPLHRNIKYPAFYNISRDEAVAKLANSPQGTLLFRPSSRGLSYLSMTWKMADNPDIFVHFLIEERMKPNPYAVGKQLIVGKEIYDDLDEIYSHHRPRLNQLTNLMIQHKNFRYGSEEDIRDMLQEEISVNNKTCYALSYSYKRCGHFLLSYIIASSSTNKQKRVQKEYIGLTFLGYKFRTNFFDDPGKLINWFKQNFKKHHPKYSKLKKYKNGQQNGMRNQPMPQYHGSLNDDGGYQHQQNNNAQFHHHPDRPQPQSNYYPPPPHHPPPPGAGGYYQQPPPQPHYHQNNGRGRGRGRGRRSRSRSRDPMQHRNQNPNGYRTYISQNTQNGY